MGNLKFKKNQTAGHGRCEENCTETTAGFRRKRSRKRPNERKTSELNLKDLTEGSASRYTVNPDFDSTQQD